MNVRAYLNRNCQLTHVNLPPVRQLNQELEYRRWFYETEVSYANSDFDWDEVSQWCRQVIRDQTVFDWYLGDIKLAATMPRMFFQRSHIDFSIAFPIVYNRRIEVRTVDAVFYRIIC